MKCDKCEESDFEGEVEEVWQLSVMMMLCTECRKAHAIKMALNEDADEANRIELQLEFLKKQQGCCEKSLWPEAEQLSIRLDTLKNKTIKEIVNWVKKRN